MTSKEITDIVVAGGVMIMIAVVSFIAGGSIADVGDIFERQRMVNETVDARMITIGTNEPCQVTIPLPSLQDMIDVGIMQWLVACETLTAKDAE